MAYDICEKCQRFFETNGGKYCKQCDDELDESREKIKEYLVSRPNASIMEIVKEAKVKLKDVNVFVESGGLSFIPSLPEQNIVNLRQEEIKKEEKIKEKRESVKLRNNFKPRRLRG